MPPLAGLLLLAAPATASQLAGLYQIRQMEVGGGLELSANGHFRYQLDYGAVSESAQGNWVVRGGKVLLTSNPMPRPPQFLLLSDRPAPRCEISVAIDWGRLNWSSPPRVLVTYTGDPQPHMAAADERGRLGTDGCNVSSIQPLVPVYGTPGERLRIAPGRGHKLRFRFRPNDLGSAAFRGEPLIVEGSDLSMRRYGETIRFVRVER